MPPAWNELLDHVLIDAETLQRRIKELGEAISRDYAGTENLMLVGILKGSVLFMSDLMRQITVPHSIDFMDITSYGVGVRESTGDVRVLMDLHSSIKDRHVLIVEDIIDSGRTLEQVMRLLEARQPASLKICTLLDKAERREVPIELAYTGFVIEDKFVFGYGLDLDEYYRNLPFIGVIDPAAVIEAS
ncbi:MAG: hypoxanthine phosphoribosyltransferase [Chloroflexi bacterium]|nr:hypoxanthine phosphoribosyltransferase [Chloroflexota bacterium]